MSRWPETAAPAWAQKEEGSNAYDVGKVEYGYVPLAVLKSRIPEPSTEDFSIPGVKAHLFSCEQVVHARMDLVFEVILDLPTRMQWRTDAKGNGAREVQMLNHHLNRIGTKHRCVIDKNSPILVTSGFTHSTDVITRCETDKNKIACAVFRLRSEGDTQRRVGVDFFVRRDFLWRMLFTIFLKRKMMNSFKASFDKLGHYCQELHTHRSPIIWQG